MILVTKPDKPLELTAKGTPRRGVCLAIYEKEIEDLYNELEHSTQTEHKSPSEWTPEATLTFTRDVVLRNMMFPVSDEDDLFQNGCDRCVIILVLSVHSVVNGLS
jgi:hypothetical protein